MPDCDDAAVFDGEELAVRVVVPVAAAECVPVRVPVRLIVGDNVGMFVPDLDDDAELDDELDGDDVVVGVEDAITPYSVIASKLSCPPVVTYDPPF